MRENTQALRAMPYYRIEKGTTGAQWATFTAPSVSQFMQFSREYAQTENERHWGERSEWLGLGAQTYPDFLASGIARESLELVKKAAATMPHRHSAFARPVASITGALWDVPSVLANVPLAARARQRQKLTPLNIRLACFWSGGINAKDIAPITAKITRAIYDYTMAGGSVTLTVGFVGRFKDRANNAMQAFIGTRVNAADLSSIATILSPAGARALGFRMFSACDEIEENPIYCKHSRDLPNTIFLDGALSKVFESAAMVLKSLEIT